MRIGREESVVEPVTERIGVGTGEGRRKGGVSGGRREERESRTFGIGERRQSVVVLREDCGE
jgi:hypothetical protein